MLETRHILEAKKQQIEKSLGELFEEVDTAIEGAMGCLRSRDRDGCDRLIRHDVGLNEKRRLIEQDCLVAIASQQPVAHDLRDIVADMRIAAELERMGDYASDIAASVLELEVGDLDALGLAEVVAMSVHCRQMLTDVSKAHRTGDVPLARRDAPADDELDAKLRQLVASILGAMRSDPSLVDNGSRLLWMAHNLERCGDRATNIAEQVVFRVEGEPVELD